MLGLCKLSGSSHADCWQETLPASRDRNWSLLSLIHEFSSVQLNISSLSSPGYTFENHTFLLLRTKLWRIKINGVARMFVSNINLEKKPTFLSCCFPCSCCSSPQQHQCCWSRCWVAVVVVDPWFSPSSHPDLRLSTWTWCWHDSVWLCFSCRNLSFSLTFLQVHNPRHTFTQTTSINHQWEYVIGFKFSRNCFCFCTGLQSY